MKPKGKLFALLAIFAAIGLVTATGAFTTVSAARTADVSVAGDSAALLAIAPAGGANSDYVSTPNGQLTFDLSAGSQGASGVNQRGETDIRAVFTITNQGTQEIGVWIETIDNTGTDYTANIALYSADAASSAVINAPAFNGGDLIGSSMVDLSLLVGGTDPPFRVDSGDNTNYVELAPGESLNVSVFVDLSPGSIPASENLLDEIIIHAEADLANGVNAQAGPE